MASRRRESRTAAAVSCLLPLALAALGLASCAASPTTTPESGATGERTVRPSAFLAEITAMQEAGRQKGKAFLRCPKEPYQSRDAGPWNEASWSLVANQGSPRHWASDAVTGIYQATTLRARFAYGDGEQPMAGEWVRIFLGNCDGWRQVGHLTTDQAGWVEIELGPMRREGHYEVVFELVGDLSLVRSRVWAFRPQRPVVVIAAPGALVDSNTYRTGDTAADSASPVMGAVELSHALLERGYSVVYAARHLRSMGPFHDAREWLEHHGFAPGPVLREAPAASAALVGALGAKFHLEAIEGLRASDLVLFRAYGGEVGDMFAIQQSGIEPAHTWALESEAVRWKVQSGGITWREHLMAISALEPARTWVIRDLLPQDPSRRGR